MYAAAIIPALFITAGRFYIPESAHWLVSQGKLEEAERRTTASASPDLSQAGQVFEWDAANGGRRASSKLHDVIQQNQQTRDHPRICAVVLKDLSSYGIGIFTPTILAASVGHKTGFAHSVTEIVLNDKLAAKGAAAIDLLLMFGFIFGCCSLIKQAGLPRMSSDSWAAQWDC